jgi:two-component system, chemotaxis family, protein-glutamate methylesterase/glutaminase
VSHIEVVVAGASAGGVEAFKTLVSHLPADFRPPVLLVQHFPENVRSALPEILARVCPLVVKEAEHEEPITSGRVYVAQSGFHMIIRAGRIRIVKGAKENMVRPAIDPLFRSAALCYGDRLAAVLLSGNLDDGSIGMAIVKQHGGTTIVQDPDEALYRDMPRNAMHNTEVDYVCPLKEIGPLLVKLSGEPEPMTCHHDQLDLTEMRMDELKAYEQQGRPSTFTCPECSGTLFELDEAKVLSYRCRVGHAFSPESVLEAHNGALEAALWAALRALEENIDLLTRMEKRARDAGREQGAKHFAERRGVAETRIDVLRRALDLPRQKEA